MPAALLTPILISAAVGAVTAAISGGNILKGALLGAVGGAIGATFLGAGAGASSGAATAGGGAGELAGSALGSATEPVASLGMASGGAEGAFSGFVGEAPWTASSGGALDFGSAATSGVSAPTSLSDMAQTTLGPVGGQTTLGGPMSAEIGVQAPQTMYQGSGDSSLFNAAKDSQLANAQLGLPADTSMTGAAVPATSQSTIETMWDRVFGKDGMLDKPGTRGLVGSALKGFADGANQQKLLDARKAEIEGNRQNARFGTQTSRFAPVGLVSRAAKTYKA